MSCPGQRLRGWASDHGGTWGCQLVIWKKSGRHRRTGRDRMHRDRTSRRGAIQRRAGRPERLEPRRLLSADSLHVGVIYLETDYLESDRDVGSDSQGDRFILSFTGGAPGTELSELRIRTDKDGDGLSVGDPMYDTAIGGRGKGGAHGFEVVRIRTVDGHSVRANAEVADGGQELVLRLENFRAGDRLEFTIDVDEIIRNSVDLAIFNDRLDVITSGQEFQDSILEATFEAPHYETAHADAIFTNDFGDPAANYGLDLPADEGDDVDSRPNRSAGAIAGTKQTPRPVEISGRVWIDNNLNKLVDSNEAGLDGVEIALWKRSDSGSYQDTGHRATTNSLGKYRFEKSLGLMPGTYRLVQQQPEGLFSVGAIAGTTDGSPSGVEESADVISEIQLPLGDTESINHDFAEAQPASLGGFVYRDLDNDGEREPGETGIPGVRVRLIPIDTLVPQSPVTATTASDGSYQFKDVSPGSYEVIEVDQPVDLMDGIDSPGRVGGRIVGMAVNPGDRIEQIKLGGADSGTEYNFAELPYGSLSGFVFLAAPGSDCDGDHEAPGNEPLAGVRVSLRNERGESVGETVTGPDGSYKFEEVPVGNYAIVETTPEGRTDGSAHVGTIDGVVVGASVDGGLIQNITMIPGGIGKHYNFCEGSPSSIRGRVYHDASGDGEFDTGENPIAGAIVSLIDDRGRVVATRQTDSQGGYLFDGLLPGQYTLRESQPAGYLDGIDMPGTVNGRAEGRSDGVDSIVSIRLQQGEDGLDYNFGERKAASLSGRVHIDRDGDCGVDGNDTPLAGTVIRLFDADGKEVAKTTTDSSGSYVFSNLDPGDYSVEQQQPAGYFDGVAHVGTEGGDAVGGNRIDSISLGSGVRASNYDFCELSPGSISGFVFQDGPERMLQRAPDPSRLREIQDGVLSEDDRLLGGVTLELRDPLGRPVPASAALRGVYADGPIRVVTDANGFYEFTGLRPGFYHVYQTQPESFVDGLDSAGSTGGFAINRADELGADELAIIAQLKSRRSNDSVSSDPGEDAILNVRVVGGVRSTDNNFSELLVVSPSTPYIAPPQRVVVPGMTVIPVNIEPLGAPTRLAAFTAPGGILPELDRYRMLWDVTDEWAVSWHLSVINGGYPRGVIVDDANVHSVSVLAPQPTWREGTHAAGIWSFSLSSSDQKPMRPIVLGEEGATALAGDFNGDGLDEVVIFVGGQWYVDLNGNGRWDAGDLWIQLGTEMDRPVVGDWDGDGKDDVAIFGRQWQRDSLRILRDPGLPDPANHRRRTMDRRAKLPIRQEGTEDPPRLLRRGDDGDLRADAVDHVFQYGEQPDTPLAGDWNGDGIDQIAVFRSGHWMIDADGDGRWSDLDQRVEFGQPGDVPIAGDFNGDEIDEIGVVRGDVWIIDIDGDRRLTGNDLQIVVPRSGEASQPVVGDLDGDGKDDPGYYDEAA